MRGKFRLFRRLWLPEFFVLLTALSLLVSAADPNLTLPAIAATGAQAVIVPSVAANPSVPFIAHIAADVSPVETVLSPPPDKKPTASEEPLFDCQTHPCLALSFDDGPNPITTPAVLNTLEQKGAKASFFLVGKNIEGNESIVQRMVADGDEIGNHTWNHTNLTTMTPDQVTDEIVSTQLALMSAGAPPAHFFRPPYGAVNEDIVKHAGLQTALWNEDPRDWQATDPAVLTNDIVSTARPGGVVDLHDIHQITVDVLPNVIDQLQTQGYQLVTVSQLMHSQHRPGDAPFYGYSAEPPVQELPNQY